MIGERVRCARCEEPVLEVYTLDHARSWSPRRVEASAETLGNILSVRKPVILLCADCVDEVADARPGRTSRGSRDHDEEQ